MAERKVANKYYPPDFDPKKIPRRKIAADRQQEVRLMAPFSMRCNTCGNYIYKGKKFNARKETALGETYFGVKIFRFYIKCPQCSAEITFKTDPKNTDYAAEHGASRNFEPWRDKSKDEEDPEADPLARIIAEEEGNKEEEDPMKSLEARTLDAKREMEILDALQDIRTRNARMERMDADGVLRKLDEMDKGKERELSAEELLKRLAEEEDEMMVRRYFGKDLARVEGEASGSGSASAKTSAEVAASSSDSIPSTKDGEKGAAPSEGSSSKGGPRIKRPLVDEEGEGEEPDVTSLLSEGMRAQLEAAKAGRIALGSSAKLSSPTSSSMVTGVKRPASLAGLGSGSGMGSGTANAKTTSTNKASPLGIVGPASKKKKSGGGTSAFGIVRKKT